MLFSRITNPNPATPRFQPSNFKLYSNLRMMVSQLFRDSRILQYYKGGSCRSRLVEGRRQVSKKRLRGAAAAVDLGYYRPM